MTAVKSSTALITLAKRPSGDVISEKNNRCRCFPGLHLVFFSRPPDVIKTVRKNHANWAPSSDTVEREYSSRRWDIRKNSISRITAFFSDKDQRDMKFFRKTDEYTRISDFLINATRDTHSSVRIEALGAISLIRPESAFDRLAEMALTDQDDNARWRAVEALSLYRNEKSADIFLETLTSDDWVVREASVRGILLLDENVQRQRLLPAIAGAMRDPNDNVSCAALSGCAIRDRELYIAATDVLRSRKKPSARLLAALMKALNGYILEDDIRRMVIASLSHQDKEVRVLALRVLKKESSLKKKSGAARP